MSGATAANSCLLGLAVLFDQPVIGEQALRWIGCCDTPETSVPDMVINVSQRKRPALQRSPLQFKQHSPWRPCLKHHTVSPKSLPAYHWSFMSYPKLLRYRNPLPHRRGNTLKPQGFAKDIDTQRCSLPDVPNGAYAACIARGYPATTTYRQLCAHVSLPAAALTTQSLKHLSYRANESRHVVFPSSVSV